MPQNDTPAEVVIAKVPAPEPGVYPGVPFETYASWDAANASLLKALDHTPALALHRLTHIEDDKPHYALGRLFHLLATQPELADGEFVEKPATYVNDKGEEKPWHGGAKACKAQMALWLSEGLTPVSADDMNQALAMADSVRTHEKLGPLMDGADVELSLVWVDTTTGVTCKARLDVAKTAAGVIGELKSARSAKADDFFNVAYRLGYHIATAMYVDAAIALGLTPEDVPTWYVFAVVEKFPPYLARAFDVHDDPEALSFAFLDLGRKVYKTKLAEYAFCRKHNKWPGYPTEHADMMLPPWVKDAEAFEMR